MMKIIIFLTFCLFGEIIFNVNAIESFEIPIYRQRLTINRYIDNNENSIHDNIKPNPWTNETISLNKFMDSEYYGVIKIGSPAKEFKMIFDTTWADSWVPSEHCGMLELACMIHTRYDSSKSSSYQENGKPYSTGNTADDLRGFISCDNFNLAHMTVENQSFVEMTHIPWIPYGFAKADGIVGLAFPNLRVIKAPTFFNNMIKQGLINKPVFTFYFNRDPTTERAGRLILGSTERKYVNGSLTAVPVIEKLYWKIKMDRYDYKKTVHLTKNFNHTFLVENSIFYKKVTEVNFAYRDGLEDMSEKPARLTVERSRKTYQFCTESCEAIFDTSTNTISGPSAEIERINELIGAKSFVPAIFKMPRYMVNCREFAKLPPIVFTIAGEDFTISSKYYIQHLTYESIEICLSPFVPLNQTFWILGGAFLMEFYTEYDFNNAQIMIGRTKY